MGLNSYKKRIVLSLLGVSLLFLFQNCGDGFSGSSQEGSVDSLSEGGGSVGLGGNTDLSGDQPVNQDDQGIGPVTTVVMTTKLFEFNASTDILFVLDDSCSMRSIIDNVKRGIASLSDVDFAPDTQMAVTYMSPAVLDDQGNYDFMNSWFNRDQIQKSVGTPGYLDFVAKGTLDSYLAGVPQSERDIQLNKNFTQKVCADSWFAPDSMDPTNSNSCFAGAMQTPMYCTVAEAGALVVDQLAKRLKQMSRKVFRNNSNAHVIFVSDTHDAGKNDFYGSSAKLPDRMPNVNELKNSLLDNNNTIQSIRFSGIVPLPLKGDAILDGLNVIGGAPETAEKQRINAELDHEFSYLDLIKSTEGVAIHADNDDWSGAIKKLIEFTETPASVVVGLKQKADMIRSVSINGLSLAPEKYSLAEDGLSVEISHNFEFATGYTVVVMSEFKK